MENEQNTQFKTLISSRKLQRRIKGLAKQIDNLYRDESLVLVCVLKGAFKFFGSLAKSIKNKNVEFDFIQVKSYVGTNSTGKVEVVKPLTLDIDGKNVVLVEDIIDTGITANFLGEYFKDKKAKDVIMCSLLQKPEKLAVELNLKTLVGFEIPNKFIVGFGLDLDEKLRNLKDVRVLD